MKKYLIGESATERIELRADDETYALVHQNKIDRTDAKAIVLNERELLELYMAIGKAIRKED